MMRLKVRRLGQGMHPSEVLVAATEADGSEMQVLVDESSLNGDGLEIGWPIRQSGDAYLVELPRESVTGAWRMWVEKQSVSRDKAEAI